MGVKKIVLFILLISRNFLIVLNWEVELIPAEITLLGSSKVLLVKDGENLKVGRPYVENAKVQAKVVCHGRGKKITVLKYKSKVNYRRKYGHRQHFTSLLIEDIIG